MCFCICAPQTKFKYNKIVNQRLRDLNFFQNDIPQENLAEVVKEVRFYNNKSKWLVFAKDRFIEVLYIVRNTCFENNQERRSFLVSTVYGMGLVIS
jgi:thermostable 8-oxoguanine DNA glycosylase